MQLLLRKSFPELFRGFWFGFDLFCGHQVEICWIRLKYGIEEGGLGSRVLVGRLVCLLLQEFSK